MANWGFRSHNNSCCHICICIFISILLLSIGSARSEHIDYRVTNIKVAPESALESLDNWQPEFERILNECNRIFQEQFSIQLIARELEYWEMESGICDMGDALCCLRRSIVPQNCDIIIGLASDEIITESSYGISSYYHGYVLIKYLESKELMKFALLHELCHIFGAEDIHEIGSIMDIKIPILNFDEFTRQIVCLNRSRSFRQDLYPLPEKNLDLAISLLSQRSELNRSEPGIHKQLARLYLEKNDLASAEQACLNAIQFSSRPGQLHNILGNILRKQKQYDRALEEYQIALTTLPKMPEIYFNIGEAHSKNCEVNKAISAYQQAIELNPHYSRAYASLSHLCLKEQKYDQAIKQCRTALKFCPYQTELHCTLAASLILKFDSISKETMLIRNQEMNGNLRANSAPHINDQAKVSIIEEALAYSTKAMEIAPELSEAYNLAGICYTYQNRFAEAEREFLKALELNSNFLQAHYNLGYLYFQNKMMAKTAHHIKKIIENSYDSELGIKLMERLFKNQSRCSVSPQQ